MKNWLVFGAAARPVLAIVRICDHTVPWRVVPFKVPRFALPNSRGRKEEAMLTYISAEPCNSLFPDRHVPPSIRIIAFRYADLQPHTLVVQASFVHSIASGVQLANMVDVCVRRNADCAIGRVERNKSHVWRCSAHGRRPGPPCHPNDSQCQPGCCRRCYAQGEYHVCARSLCDTTFSFKTTRYFKAVDKFNEWTVSAFITPGS